jgi:hypothetical protein
MTPGYIDFQEFPEPKSQTTGTRMFRVKYTRSPRLAESFDNCGSFITIFSFGVILFLVILFLFYYFILDL